VKQTSNLRRGKKESPVPTPTEVREIAIRHGRRKKGHNALAALLCGVLPAVLLGVYSTLTWKAWLLGLLAGLIWGNAFEYAYHRWLLHRPRSPLGAGHREHHAHVRTPEEAEHVTLGSSPLNIVILFATNGVLAFLISFPLSLWGMLSGVFAGWTIYIIMAEEIHWRIHMNSWLPPGFHFARAYHMSHHDIPNSRYNVFLPVFDLLFRNTGLGKSRVPTRPAST
jgi:Fatty acid hydroxylase superfamily